MEIMQSASPDLPTESRNGNPPLEGKLSRLAHQLRREVAKRKKAEKRVQLLNTHFEEKAAKRTAHLKSVIRQLKKAIDHAYRKAQEAKAANRAKSDFLANMSHELRTPLNHIIGFTELVADQHFGELNDTQEEYLRHVLQSSRHLLALINDILDLSKVEAGKLELTASEILLKPFLESSLVMIKEQALKHGLRLTANMQAAPETIMADERKLKQIIYNLLSNAAKFTPDGGTISLTACRLQPDPPDQPPGAQISITDTGIGIKPYELKRIFKPFEQAGGSSNPKIQGTGLGLSLTKRLVELHGGRIWAESEGVGSGTTFRFVLPHHRPGQR